MSIIRPINAIADEAGAGNEEEIGEEPGVRITLKMADPKKPKKEEVEEHWKTHLPFRNWCEVCVRGRGKEEAHRKSEEERGLPEVHIDFCFLGAEHEPGEALTILIVKERATKMAMATVVPSKSTGCFVSERVVAWMAEVGIDEGVVTDGRRVGAHGMHRPGSSCLPWVVAGGATRRTRRLAVGPGESCELSTAHADISLSWLQSPAASQTRHAKCRNARH